MRRGRRRRWSAHRRRFHGERAQVDDEQRIRVGERIEAAVDEHVVFEYNSGVFGAKW